MPSLEQLKNFKNSFGNIAGEPMTLSQLGLPPDDLPLPDSEPIAPPPVIEPAPPRAAPPEPAAEAAPPAAAPRPGPQAPAGRAAPGPSSRAEPSSPQEPSSPIAPSSPAEPSSPVELDDLGLGFDIADLLGGDPANLPPPPAAEAVLEEALARAAPETDIAEAPPPDAAEYMPDIPDMSFDEVPAGIDEAESGVASAADDINLDDADLDALFANFDNADIGEAETGDETAFPDIAEDVAEPPDFSDIDLDAGLDTQDFPDFGDDAAWNEAGGADDTAAFPDIPGDLAGLPDFDDTDLGAGPETEVPAEDAEESGAMEGLLDGLADDSVFPDRIDPENADGNFSEPETEAGIASENDGVDAAFDNFSPDGAAAGFGGDGESGVQDAADPEFIIPGLDDLLGGNAPKIGGMGTSPGQAAAGGMAPEDTVEEIRLDEFELSQLQATLSGYPLNLRIAIEEIIAEQAIAPNLMSSLIKLLARNGSPREASALAAKILGKPVPIPRGFEKKTGAELEAEQASFRYIFAHRFLPTLRLSLFIALVAASIAYLGYQFIYTPARANSIYKQGYALIPEGNYAQANERFNRAFQLHRQKNWFYQYAEAFRDERQYIYAEEKYDQLLSHYPRDKKGALEYADMETKYLRNYAKADRILRRNLLEYSIDDKEGLMALGDNNLLWGEIDPSRYEEARSSFARLLEVYGWQDPIVERMLQYFIRVDNLGEVLPLQRYFMADPERRRIAGSTLAELGGYLLDKRFEEARGVPDEHIGQIEGIRDVLLRAVRASPRLPEAHYHLARYYARFGNALEERQTLEIAARAFDIAVEESSRRTHYRLNAQNRLGELLIRNREFFAAEEQLVKGVAIYEDALDRRILTRSPEFGKLYANLGDLEYFAKSGDMGRTLEYYLQSEQNGWAPPEIQYRIGAAYYQQEQWGPALDRFFAISSTTPANRRLLNALGNVSYLRGDYFNAQSYYNRLMDMLEVERARFPMLMPNDRPEHLELAERMMTVRNNLAVTLEALTKTTGNRSYRSRALGLYAESERAWDALTRNPDTMIRAGAGDLSSPGVNLAFLNSRNTLYPEPDYEPQIYIQIDRDLLEPSEWEALVPHNFRRTDVVGSYRQ